MFCSNMSLDEILRYTDIPEDVKDLIEGMVEEITDLKRDVENLEKAEERISEQVYFARELIENMDAIVERLPYRKTGIIPEFIKDYERAKEESYFEL